MKPLTSKIRTGAAIAALALLAVACGPSAQQADQQQEQTGSATEAELRLIMEEVPDTDVVRDLLDEFNAEYPDIAVDIEALPYDQMRDRIITSALAPEPTYDVVLVDNPWMVDFADGGYLQPLRERVEGTEGYEYEDFAEPLRAIGEVDDEIYGVPFYNYALSFIYRRDVLEQVGAEPPSDIEGYRELVRRISDQGELSGAAMQPQRGYKIFEEWANWLYAYDGRLTDDDGQVVLDSPEAREALEAYIDVYTNDAPENSLNWGFDEALRAVSAGEAATLLSYNWMLPTLNAEDGPAGDLAGEFEVAEVPGGTAVLGAWHWALAANTDQSDAAWTFVSWISSPEHDRERVIAGGAPVRNSVMEDPEVQEQGFGEQYYTTVQAILDDAVPLAQGPNAEEVINVVGTHLNAAVAGEETVDEAITAAAEEAEQAFGATASEG